MSPADGQGTKMCAMKEQFLLALPEPENSRAAEKMDSWDNINA
jgi:hypothetical protein